MSKDCYFYIDMEQDVPEEDRAISPLCVNCKQEKFPNQDVGWFWDGSNGFGPWVYKCKICGTVIHDPNQEEHEEIETTN